MLDWNDEDDELSEVDVYGFIQALRKAQLEKDRKEQNLDVSLRNFVINS